MARVGSSLQHASLSYDQRHPVLLPPKGRFINILLNQSFLFVTRRSAGQHSDRNIGFLFAYEIRSCKIKICHRTRSMPNTLKVAPPPKIRVDGSRRSFG